MNLSGALLCGKSENLRQQKKQHNRKQQLV